MLHPFGEDFDKRGKNLAMIKWRLAESLLGDCADEEEAVCLQQGGVRFAAVHAGNTKWASCTIHQRWGTVGTASVTAGAGSLN